MILFNTNVDYSFFQDPFFSLDIFKYNIVDYLNSKFSQQ